MNAIGSGGMGEVYRARDTRLKRDVAIKILPDDFAHDPERLARFQREAELLATLNHPNIAQIYGLEDRALVLELVEGPTLADRISTGPTPIDEALAIAGQLAEALEAAHERGIIHRDLKPANIKLTHDGKVKVLDFGLAKASQASDSGLPPSGLSHSPTITSPAMATHAGIILGTAAYMSPEQARGKTVDQRTDIWAFACVLYEMLTGRRAFAGEDVSDTLAAILRSEPDWSALPNNTPSQIRLLLQRSLEKDRSGRISNISVPRFLLSHPEPSTPTTAKARSERLHMVAAVLTLLAGAAIGAVTAAVWVRKPEPISPAVTRFVQTLDATGSLGGHSRNALAVSPQGTHIVAVTTEGLILRLCQTFNHASWPEPSHSGSTQTVRCSRPMGSGLRSTRMLTVLYTR